jgi:iron complex transport system substrate-binding protein
MRFVLACFLCFYLSAVFAASVTDDTGQVVSLKNPAQRIISLAPDITEILFAVGAGSQVVGVIKGSDFPAAARKLPIVGSYTGVDLERVVALHPDLIIAWHGTFLRELAVLHKMGIPVYLTKPRRLEDIPRTMRHLGVLAGSNANALQAAATYTQRLQALKLQFQQRSPVTIFYQIGDMSLMTVNKDSWINQAITLCGGRNVFAQMKSIAPTVDWEAVVTANPEVIISDAEQADWKTRWQRWQRINAVKHQFLFRIDPSLIERASPRLIEGAKQICTALQQAR